MISRTITSNLSWQHASTVHKSFSRLLFYERRSKERSASLQQCACNIVLAALCLHQCACSIVLTCASGWLKRRISGGMMVRARTTCKGKHTCDAETTRTLSRVTSCRISGPQTASSKVINWSDSWATLKLSHSVSSAFTTVKQ